MSITNSVDLSEFKPLLRLKNPPKKLFYKGNLDLLKAPKISIVGSRKMSVYAKTLISSLSFKLAKSGVCVVSGAALGCDGAAHESAYPNTIAVFANGLDIIYPKTNKLLIENIYKNSLALSEYPDKTTPLPHQFLERNRIVVALSKALVVAQAELKSGSLQSARLAFEMGIPVFVLPHRINESRGTNELVAKNRANLIDDIDEFVENFCAKISDKAVKNLGDKGDEILEFIKSNSSFDEIYNKFGDKIYEYELDGKLEILGTKVVLK